MGSALITGYRSPLEMTVGHLLAGLPELLGAMFVDARCLAAVVEFGDGRYVQFWAEGGSSLVSEVIANQHPTASRVLSAAQELRLVELGWTAPGSAREPNWCHVARNAAGLIECVEMVRTVVAEVLGEDDDDVASLRSWVVRRDRDVAEDVAREQGRNAFRRSLGEIRWMLDSD